MKNTIKTKHAIGDAVYTATAHGIDRKIIDRIKVVGLKNIVSYGFTDQDNVSIYSMFFRNNESWYKGSDLFVTKEEADKRYDKLKLREKQKEEAQKLQDILDMEHQLKIDQENLRRKKQGLPLLDSNNDSNYDD